MRKLRLLLPLIALALASDLSGADKDRGKNAEPLDVGDCAPDFKLDDHDGKLFTLSEARGKENVVLVFYRGSF
jgi:cytochrome oxidase Cu insertion factor (SCO1/SenC/PrrC family)